MYTLLDPGHTTTRSHSHEVASLRVILLLAAAMCVLLVVPATPAFASHDAFCGADQQIKEGTSSADTLSHRSGANQAWCYDLADGADDYTNNSAWDDVVFGGRGNDSIDGSDYGFETLDGGPGNDTARGLSGIDVLYGGDGSDTIRGGAMNDTLFGGDHCTETSYWGWWTLFDSGTVDPAACSDDGGDFIYGGDGQKDWLWDSNSDNYADGVADYLDGGDGSNDICTGGIEDTFVNCETVHIIPDI